LIAQDSYLDVQPRMQQDAADLIGRALAGDV
jgi:hypothetical protein